MSARVLRPGRALRAAALTLAALWLVGCAGEKPKPTPSTSARKAEKKPWRPLGPYTPGGLYAPGVADGAPAVPPDVEKLPEPVPHPEPLARYGNRSPYTVLGKSYTVLPSAAGYDEIGVASWYGTKFDGRVTSSLEPYDLSQFSAAHRTLPLPSYARVTNLENGRSVIVRINDRGPFHDGRLIDLSYAAAIKLGVNVRGTARVEVRGIDTGTPPSPEARAASANPRAVSPASREVARKPATAVAPPVPSTAPAPAPYSDAIAAFASKPVPPAPREAMAVSAPLLTANTTKAVSDNPASPDERNRSAPLPASSVPAPTVANPTTPPAAAPVAKAPIVDRPAAPATPTDASPRPAAPVATPSIAASGLDPATIGFLQVGSYGDRDNAQRMSQRLQQAGIGPVQLVAVQVGMQTLWRVHVGPLRADEAAAIAARMQAQGMSAPPFFRQ